MTNFEIQMTKEFRMPNVQASWASEQQARHSILAVSMQSEVTLALTLTLSPRRGNRQWPRRKNSLNGEPFPALEKVLPLPGGEGWGEGELEFQLNSSGLGFGIYFVISHLSFDIHQAGLSFANSSRT